MTLNYLTPIKGSIIGIILLFLVILLIFLFVLLVRLFPNLEREGKFDLNLYLFIFTKNLFFSGVLSNLLTRSLFKFLLSTVILLIKILHEELFLCFLSIPLSFVLYIILLVLIF